MSFFNRPFPMVGRKLLSLTPLGLQLVDPNDSVLGPLSRFPNKGLNTTITVYDSSGAVIYDRGGVLSGGNLQAYAQ